MQDSEMSTASLLDLMRSKVRQASTALSQRGHKHAATVISGLMKRIEQIGPESEEAIPLILEIGRIAEEYLDG